MFDQVTPSSSSVFGLKVFSILTVVPRRGFECFNGWGGRGYDNSVPGEVTETTPSRDRTT